MGRISVPDGHFGHDPRQCWLLVHSFAWCLGMSHDGRLIPFQKKPEADDVSASGNHAEARRRVPAGWE